MTRQGMMEPVATLAHPSTTPKISKAPSSNESYCRWIALQTIEVANTAPEDPSRERMSPLSRKPRK